MRFYATSVKRTFGILPVLAGCLAWALAPASAGAEYFIPDGNSAVQQYTESIPTGGGKKDSRHAAKRAPRPDRALGKRNVERLESAGGREGREAVEVLAESAPPQSLAAERVESRVSRSGSERGERRRAARPGAGGGGKRRPAGPRPAATPPGEAPRGSGAVGEIAAAATGGAAGGAGLPLLTAMLATAAWGVWYGRRRADGRNTNSRS